MLKLKNLNIETTIFQFQYFPSFDNNLTNDGMEMVTGTYPVKCMLSPYEKNTELFEYIKILSSVTGNRRHCIQATICFSHSFDSNELHNIRDSNKFTETQKYMLSVEHVKKKKKKKTENT